MSSERSGPAQADPSVEAAAKTLWDESERQWAEHHGRETEPWAEVEEELRERFRDGARKALAAADRARPQSRLEDATGGKPFGECSREELLEACRWFWMARDEARAELAADRAREPDQLTEDDWWRLRKAFVTTNGGAFLAPQMDLLRAFLASGEADG